MIETIELKNFKNFSKINLNKMKQINLVVGKNNVGKTNLLEALFIGSNPTNLSLFISTLTNRLKVFSPQLLEYFFGNVEEPISIKLNELHAQYFLFKEDGEITGIQSLFKDRKYVLRFQQIINEHLQIKNLSPAIIEEKFIPRQDPPSEKVSILSILISPNHLINITNILSKLLKKGLRNQILSVFKKIFNQKIENIFFESAPSVIYIETENKVLPLSFYGEGTLRVFYIWMLALDLYYKSSLSENLSRVILIDEIENGLHYSAKSLLWDLIFKIAEEFNIQFFITTHDEEFFCSLFELKDVEKYKELFQLIRLRKDQTAAYYDFEMLKLIAKERKEALKEIWEIRG